MIINRIYIQSMFSIQSIFKCRTEYSIPVSDDVFYNAYAIPVRIADVFYSIMH